LTVIPRVYYDSAKRDGGTGSLTRAAGSIWVQNMADTVLVTGGAGFIGSHLVESMLGSGWNVVAYDNFDEFYDPAVKRANLAGVKDRPEFALVEGDIRDSERLQDTFGNYEPTVVVHLAARAGVRPSVQQPALYQDVNCTGTLRMLECAYRFGVKNFVFGSSSSVYGTTSTVPFREDDPADRPISPYAATKRAGEMMCHTYHSLYDLRITCLRFFTVYGARQRPDLAIHKFTRLIEHGDEVPVYGDGSAQRDYTFVDDIIHGVIQAIGRPADFEIFNLGECNTISVMDLIALIEKSLGKKARVKFKPPQPGDVPITYADISKARELLGYNPSTPIEHGIPKFVDWYRSVHSA